MGRGPIRQVSLGFGDGRQAGKGREEGLASEAKAVNNRKRKAADSAEFRPTRARPPEPRGRRELEKVNATVLRVIDRVSAKIR